MRAGFTLIELLVVIAIIVLLLALLVPALDKAIYQAELLQCAAQLDGVASGTVGYALEHKRSYPHRTGVLSGGRLWEPYKLSNPDPNQGHDDRSLLATYLPLKMLVCPLIGEQYSIDFPDTEPDTHTHATYALWFGFQYDTHARMSRMGARWTFRTTDGFELKSNLLAGDWDLNVQNNGYGHGTHPDKTGRRVLRIEMNNDSFDPQNPGAAFADRLLDGETPTTGAYRGPLDTNVAAEDGSVRKLADTTAGPTPADDDPRLVRVPNFDTRSQYPGTYLLVPKY